MIEPLDGRVKSVSKSDKTRAEEILEMIEDKIRDNNQLRIDIAMKIKLLLSHEEEEKAVACERESEGCDLNERLVSVARDLDDANTQWRYLRNKIEI